MSRRVELALLSVMGTLIVALVALNVVAFGGSFDGDEPSVAPIPPLDTTEEPETTARVVTRGTEATAPPEPPELRLVARRGDCYLQARRGSPQGEVLYDGILRRGQTTDFAAARVWLRLGASTHVDATLDGEVLDLPDGTVDVVVTRDGVASS